MDVIESKKLMRGKTFVAGGVCSGLANYYGWRKGGLQASFVITTLFLGFPLLVYLVLWMVLPKAE